LDGERRSFLKRFVDNLSSVPEEKPPVIPGPWRVPFFLGMSAVALVILALLLALVVGPAIRQQQSVRPSVVAPAK
jgi:hypothetical protein